MKRVQSLTGIAEAAFIQWHYGSSHFLWLDSPVHILCKKGKVFYGQEPPSGESTTTECGVNYQLLAVITEVAQ